MKIFQNIFRCHYVKYARSELSLTHFFQYKDRNYDSLFILENTCQRKYMSEMHILRSVFFCNASSYIALA